MDEFNVYWSMLMGWAVFMFSCIGLLFSCIGAWFFWELRRISRG